MTNNTSNLYPVPQTPDPMEGYAALASTRRADYGMHTRGTVAASLAGTVLATAAYGLAGAESPAANIGFSFDVTHGRQVVDSHTEITRDENQLQTMVSRRIDAATTESHVENRAVRNVSIMPGVATYDLNRHPDAQRITNPGDLTSFVLGIKQDQANGWVVTKVEREARASDERNVGERDAGNERLAAQRGEFVDGAFQAELDAAGVTLPGAEVVKTSGEVVMEGQFGEALDATLARLGYSSAEQLISDFKKNPDSLSAEARNAVARFFESQRGAEHTVHMTRTHTERASVYETTTTARCIEDVTRHITTEAVSTHYDGNIPIVPLLLPVIRRRRKDEFLTGQEKQPATPPEAEESDDSAAPTEQAPAAVVEPTDSASAAYPAWASRVSTRQVPERTPRQQYWDDRLRWERWERHDRRNRIARRVIGGALLAAAAASLRFDAGYCPDPQNAPNQDYNFSRPLPDALFVGIGIPFTDIETGKVNVLPTYCSLEKEAQPPIGGGTPAEPTCDTRHTTITDGRITKVEETHHPRATTTVTKIEPR